jgi:CRP-like cAMP-binding protein
MAPSDAAPPSTRNRFLSALPPDDLARLWPQPQPVELSLRYILQPPETPMASLYLPESGWVLMLAYMEDGAAAEVGLVGREGLVGLPVLLDDECDDLVGMVQAESTALRMAADAFREALDAIPTFGTLMLRYALVHHGQVARSACNGRHTTEQRLARWMLMAHDRAEGDRFPITHEFLSMMLSVRRAGVSVAAGRLQKAGFIRYDRGQMEITDRPGLESASCECYGIVRRASERLLQPGGSARSAYRR